MLMKGRRSMDTALDSIRMQTSGRSGVAVLDSLVGMKGTQPSGFMKGRGLVGVTSESAPNAAS